MTDVGLDALAPSSDAELVAALRSGDEDAFVGLVRAHHSVLLGVAMAYVGDRAVAEEVVQATWLGVLHGLDGFEGRSSLKAWIYRIAANIARTRAARERRCRPFSSVRALDPDAAEPAVEPERFLARDHPAWPGRWASWGAARALPEERLLARETRALIRAAIERLPPAQRFVLTLRDVEGWSADETCEALGLTPANQRVLLHRARSRVRAVLERHIRAADSPV